ncbi:hypothetical protein PVK06_026710 [Gossypium arboreum]|uniref:Uncharacterized protein n=1 Tax=Gossypium arboreum TaxID=29729 RepID=A0ABR0NYE8_GOSAR|nr:hypothetical protein PVK06_026710 [Gossypium arboreum]
MEVMGIHHFLLYVDRAKIKDDSGGLDGGFGLFWGCFCNLSNDHMGMCRDMTFEGERDREESSASPERVTVQELEDNGSLLTFGSDNPELGIEALTQLVREVLEGVFEAKMREISEMLQSRCVDCGKKRYHSSPRLEPHSAKRVRTHPSDSKGVGFKL